MKRSSFALWLALLSAGCSLTVAQTTTTGVPVCDNGDGTFTNPVIRADFPDPDVKKVGDTYYLVTTTMHHFPGCTLLKSKDLVNWQYCCNPLDKISNEGEYNLENNRNIYSKGSWANSLMVRNGRFYILFNAFGMYGGEDGGGYLLTATRPEGPWTMKHLVRGYYDPGLLADDDGQIYVVCGNTNLSVIQLDENFAPLKEVKVIENFNGLEGSHFIKKDGWYYIYSTCYIAPASQWCLRSKNPFGPYERKRVFQYDDLHQGALIQTDSGEWWTMLMRDCGSAGRMPNLLPVVWQDDWPVIGRDGRDAKTYKKPNTGITCPSTPLPADDGFSSSQLGMQWQWNHNPDAAKWSLTERKGYLRLHTACVTDSMPQARNTITQRAFVPASKESYGTIRMDISRMKDGDMAGLAVFQEPYAFIAVKKQGGKAYFVHHHSVAGDTKVSEAIKGNVVYLRAIANFGNDRATFYYSTDGKRFTRLGTDMKMQYKLTIFVGNRFFIFNYATKATGGWVDVDWFSTLSDTGSVR